MLVMKNCQKQTVKTLKFMVFLLQIEKKTIQTYVAKFLSKHLN